MVLVCFLHNARADTVETWTGNVSNSWSNAGNWSGGVVPNGAFSVTIPMTLPVSPGFPPFSSTLDTSVTLDNLSLVSSSLTVNSAQTLLFNANGALSISGSILDIGGTVTLTNPGDTVTLTSGGDLYIAAGGALTVGTGASLTNYNSTSQTLSGGDFSLFANSTLQVAGADLVNNDSQLYLAGQFIDQNGANALRDLATNQSDASLYLLNALTDNQAFTNYGTLYVGGSFTGTGTFTQDAGVSEINGTLSDSGVILNGGQFFGVGTIASYVTNNLGVFVPSRESPVIGVAHAPGTLSVGGYSQGSGGTFEFIFDTPSANSPLDVTGNGNDVNLAGILDISLGYYNPPIAPLPAAGIYTILSDPNGTISGNFSDVECPSVPGYNVTCQESISADRHNVLLAFSVATPEPSGWVLLTIGLAFLLGCNFVSEKRRLPWFHNHGPDNVK